LYVTASFGGAVMGFWLHSQAVHVAQGLKFSSSGDILFPLWLVVSIVLLFVMRGGLALVVAIVVDSMQISDLDAKMRAFWFAKTDLGVEHGGTETVVGPRL